MPAPAKRLSDSPELYRDGNAKPRRPKPSCHLSAYSGGCGRRRRPAANHSVALLHGRSERNIGRYRHGVVTGLVPGNENSMLHVLHGLLLSFAARYDANVALPFSRGYFAYMVGGYAAGLLLANLAVIITG